MRLLLGSDDLAPGEIRIVRHPAGRPPRKSLLLVRTDDGLRCWWNVCKHLPIPLDGGLGRLDVLVCNTHGAEYDASGLCVDGPCEGERLDPVDVEIEDGRIYAVF